MSVNAVSHSGAKFAERHPSKRHIIEEYYSHKFSKRETKFSEMIEEVKEFGLSVGFVRDVLKAKSKRMKVFWFIAAIALLATCITEITRLTLSFVSAPTTTKISYTVNSSILFPRITICSYARANNSDVKRRNISDALLTYMMSSFSGMYVFYNNFNIRDNVKELQIEYEAWQLANKNMTLYDFFLKVGFVCSKFLKSCMFQGTQFDCCSNTKEILADIGKCFVVVSPTFKAQTIPGPMGGLKVYVDNQGMEYPETMINTNPDEGLQVHIIHPTDSSQTGVNPIVVFPNTHALIRLNAVYQDLKPNAALNTSCVIGRELIFYDKYSFEGCFKECIAKLTNQTCQCVQIGFLADQRNNPKLTQLQKDKLVCTPKFSTSCVQPLFQANDMGFLWDIYNIQDECDCPLPCTQWTYEIRIPSPGYARAKKLEVEKAAASRQNNTSEVEAMPQGNDFMILDMFFDNLVFTVIEETDTFTPTVFLSNIGGQLSIWLGIRLITVLHLLYYGIMTIIYVIPVWFIKMKNSQPLKNLSPLNRKKKNGNNTEPSAPPMPSISTVTHEIQKEGGESPDYMNNYTLKVPGDTENLVKARKPSMMKSYSVGKMRVGQLY